jgi:hypothetical protein
MQAAKEGNVFAGTPMLYLTRPVSPNSQSALTAFFKNRCASL